MGAQRAEGRLHSPVKEGEFNIPCRQQRQKCRGDRRSSAEGFIKGPNKSSNVGNH